MNKLVLPDVDNEEYSGTLTALIRNGYVVYCFRIAVEKSDIKGKSFTEWERWIYYCRIESVRDFLELIDKFEKNRLTTSPFKNS